MLGEVEERETKVLRKFEAVKGFIRERPVQWEEWFSVELASNYS